MANYNVGAGQTYATWEDAKAAAVAAIGSTPPTEEQNINIYGGATLSENITIPAASVCATYQKFPLVTRTAPGEARATLSGYLTSEWACCGFRFENLAFTKFGSNGTSYFRRAVQGAEFKNCKIVPASGVNYVWNIGSVIFFNACELDLLNSAVYIMSSETNSGDSSYSGVAVNFWKCLIRLPSATNGSMLHTYRGQMTLSVERCAILGSSSTCSLVRFERTAPFVTIKQSAFYNVGYVLNSYNALSYGHQFDVRNNIFHTVLGAVINLPVDGSIGACDVFDGNRYYNCAKIINAAAYDYDTLAALKTDGYETNGSSDDPGFVSTTWGNANFLKLSASLATAKNCGVTEDYFGTAMQKYADIDPGYHQHTATNEPPPSGIIKSFGGTWNDDNLKNQADFTSNIKINISGGLGWIGGYAGEAIETSTTPSGFFVFDRHSQNGGELYFTITNASNYTTNDVLILYDSSGNIPIDSFAANTGSGNICNLTNNLEYTIYSKVFESGKLISNYSNSSSATPTISTDTNSPSTPIGVSLDGPPSVPYIVSIT